MAVTGLGRQETCIVHHDRPAAARCGRCHKPVCEECVISATDGKFCSRECAGKAADFRANAAKFKAKGPGVGGLVKKLVILAILLFVLGGVNKYFFGGKMPVVGKWLNKLPVVGTTQRTRTPKAPETPKTPETPETPEAPEAPAPAEG